MAGRPGGRKFRGARVGVRVAVAVVADGRLLVVQHDKGGRGYWVLPGGKLEGGEGLRECGRRELREETGLEIEVSQLLYLSDHLASEEQVVDVTFRGVPVGGRPRPGVDPELVSGPAVLGAAKWVSLEELRGLDLLPPIVKEALMADWAEGFARGARYLG